MNFHDPSVAALFSLFIAIGVIILTGNSWSQLSEKYHCDESSFIGSWKGWQSGRIGWISYRHCLWIGIAAEGLYLKVGPLFKFQPPLYIPWSAIKSVEERKYWWWCRVLEIKLNDSDIKIMLWNQYVLDKGKNFLGDKFIPM